VVSTNDERWVVLDKALNYGNSGGPVMATETGHVHALCSFFQPVKIPQEHLRQAGKRMPYIIVPSLYGVVANLSHPKVLAELQARGVPLGDA
jgi:hypothetical protein